MHPHIGLAPAAIGHCDSVAGHRRWTPTQRNSNTIGFLICTHVHTPAVPTTINSIHIHSSYSVLRSLLVLLLHTVTPGPDNCSKLVHNASLFTTHSAADASLCGKTFFSARRLACDDERDFKCVDESCRRFRDPSLGLFLSTRKQATILGFVPGCAESSARPHRTIMEKSSRNSTPERLSRATAIPF